MARAVIVIGCVGLTELMAASSHAQVGARVAIVIESATVDTPLEEALIRSVGEHGAAAIPPSEVRGALAFIAPADGAPLDPAMLEALRGAVGADALLVVEVRRPDPDRPVFRVRVWNGAEVGARFGQSTRSALSTDVAAAARESLTQVYGGAITAAPVLTAPVVPAPVVPTPIQVAPPPSAVPNPLVQPAPPVYAPPQAPAVGAQSAPLAGPDAITMPPLDGPLLGAEAAVLTGLVRVSNHGNRDLCSVTLHPADGNPAALHPVGRVGSGASEEVPVAAGQWRAVASTCSGNTVATRNLSVPANGEAAFDVSFEIRHPFRISASFLLFGHLYSVGNTGFGALALGAHVSAAFQLSENDGWGLGVDGFFTSRTMLDNADVGFVGGMLAGISKGPGVLLGVGWMSFTPDHFGFALGAHTPIVTFAKVMALSVSAVIGFADLGQLVIYTQLGAGLGVHY